MKRAPSETPENIRITGTPIYTPLIKLPERFTYGPHTEQMSRYLARRWRAQSYGWWARSHDTAILYNPEWKPEKHSGQRYRFVEHPHDGLRFVGDVQDIRMPGSGNLPYIDRAMVDHNGWYVDNYQDETVCGRVYQLPARGGKWQYVPAISDPWNDGAILDFHSVTDDIKDAIRWADSMAETYAEDEREYQVVSAPQLFPTPADVAARMVEAATVGPEDRVLEPSAGTGNLLKALHNHDWNNAADCSGEVVAVEISRAMSEALQRRFPYVTLHQADFLECNGNLGLFDVILMNPPFAAGQDIKHILHAVKFLKPGGRLVAICANGPERHAKLKPLADEWHELPPDTFKESGTGVNTAMLVIRKPEDSF
jgi:protein-L-isoaspartate O-methyltransferase